MSLEIAPQVLWLADPANGDRTELKAQMDPSKMPFDGQRMFWGGFQTVVGLSPGQ